MSDTGTSGLNNYLQGSQRLCAVTWVDTSDGPSHKPHWTSVCKIEGKPRGTGEGPTKSEARDTAANSTLAWLKSLTAAQQS